MAGAGWALAGMLRHRLTSRGLESRGAQWGTAHKFPKGVSRKNDSFLCSLALSGCLLVTCDAGASLMPLGGTEPHVTQSGCSFLRVRADWDVGVVFWGR